jgi:hypothetical protein
MKKILVISMVLALVLVLMLPSVAMAAAPKTSFNASGVMSGIDDGQVKELGNSGKWLVTDRHIQGQFLSGDLGTSSAFTLTYGGVFKLADQSGELLGTLKANNDTFLITGKVAPYVITDMGGYQLPKLNISGHWNSVKGIKANGDFAAWMIFVPTADGHVAYIAASSFIMNGKYTGK